MNLRDRKTGKDRTSKEGISKYWPIIATTAMWSIAFFFLLDANLLKVDNDGWYSSAFAWGDIHWHLAVITNLAERGWGAVKENPIYAGVHLRYPFIYDALTALIVKTGLSLRDSLFVTTYPLLCGLTVMISITSYRLTRSIRGAALVPWLYYLFSSPYAYVQALSEQGIPWISMLTHPSKNLTHGPEFGVYITNPLSDFLIPQRPIIVGFILGLLIINLIYSCLHSRKLATLSGAAIILGLLPLLHTHSFLTLSIILAGTTILDCWRGKERKTRVKNWIIFYLIAGVLALPQLYFLKPELGTFIRLQAWWVIGEEHWIPFWIKNLGLYIPLFIYASWKASDEVKKIILPTLFVFIIIHVIVFQPYKWDNTKFLQWFLLLHMLLIPLCWNRNKQHAVWKWTQNTSGIVLLIIILLPGISCYAYGLQSKMRVFSTQDLELGEYVKEHTPTGALFLTSYRPDNPIVSLAGRRLLSGFGTWLWSHGIDSKRREDDIKVIYRGGSEADLLLQKYKVNYVLIEEDKMNELQINEDFFRQRGNEIFTSTQYRLYSIP